MHIPKLLRSFALCASLCLAALLPSTSARATVTVLDYYRMGDENLGGPFAGYDSVGSNHLTAVGQALYGGDVSAMAAARVNSGVSMAFGPASGLTAGKVLTTATDNFGLELWVEPQSVSGGRCVAYNGDTGSAGWGIYQFDNTFAAFYGGIGTFGSAPVTFNTWVHLALVRSGGTATLYVNGVAAGTSATTPNLPAGNFSIAAKPALNGEFFLGKIDEVRVFTFAPGQFSTNDLLYNAPDIAVAQPTGNNIADGGSRDFGTVIVGGNASLTFTVSNGGVSPLTGLGISINGTDATQFSVTANPSAPVAAGGSTTFTVKFMPTSAGSKSATLRVVSNDPEESPFDIQLAGSGGSPEIEIYENGVGTPLFTGNVIIWGDNVNQVNQVPAGLTGVRAVAAGDTHIVALKSDGTVVAWGNPVWSQVPAGLTGVQAIAAGGYHSLALKTDGTIVGWGYNGNGEINLPVGLTGVQAIATGHDNGHALKSDGTVVSWGRHDAGQTNVPAGLTGVQAISAGFADAAALKSNGTVVSWGENFSGSLTVPGGLTGVQAISMGGHDVLALKNDGTLVTWGQGYAQFNLPPGLNNLRAVAQGLRHSLALRNDGTVVAWGLNDKGQADVPAGLTGVQSIAAGGDHSLALVNSTVDFGEQTVGQSGVKTFSISNSGSAPLSIGNISTIGGNTAEFVVSTSGMQNSLSENGGVMTFTVTFTPGTLGPKKTTLRVLNNDSDEGTFDIVLTGTGINPEIGVFNGASTNAADARTNGAGTITFPNAAVGGASPVQTFTIQNTGIGNLALSASVSGANPGDFVISPTGTTSLAPNATTTFNVIFAPMARGIHNAVVAIASNDADENPFTINVNGTGLTPKIVIEQPAGMPLSTGTVVVWGNTMGGLLDVPAGLKGVRAIAAGSSHNVAVKNNGSLFAWGGNSPGTDVPAWERDIQAVAANMNYSMGLRSDGTFVVWGMPSGNQLSVPAGLTGVQAFSAGRSFALALKGDGTIASWGTNADGLSTVPPALAAGVQAISAGVDHALALKGDGTVVGWGSDLYGRATVPPGLNGVQAIAAGGLHSVALKNDGTFAAWGDNSEGELNAPAGLTGVVALSAGSRHTLALRSDHTVVAWGGNSAGQATVPAGLTGVRAISAGAFHSLALVDSTVDFGNQSVGITSVKKTFTIKNTGLDPLNITGVSVVGTNAADFSVGTSGMSGSLQASIGTTAFAVFFTPTAAGYRTATLRVLSDGGDESTFDIALSGTGTLTALDAWRLQYFGSTANSGNSANLFDFDGDGLTNLIEFAFGLNPTKPHNPLSPLENFPQAQFSGGNLTYTFSTPAGVSGIIYGAEWTTSLLPNDWHAIPDTGAGSQHIFIVPVNGVPKLFTRLVVTTP